MPLSMIAGLSFRLKFCGATNDNAYLCISIMELQSFLYRTSSHQWQWHQQYLGHINNWPWEYRRTEYYTKEIKYVMTQGVDRNACPKVERTKNLNCTLCFWIE